MRTNLSVCDAERAQGPSGGSGSSVCTPKRCISPADLAARAVQGGVCGVLASCADSFSLLSHLPLPSSPPLACALLCLRCRPLLQSCLTRLPCRLSSLSLSLSLSRHVPSERRLPHQLGSASSSNGGRLLGRSCLWQSELASRCETGPLGHAHGRRPSFPASERKRRERCGGPSAAHRSRTGRTAEVSEVR